MDQEDLETVIPALDGTVLILNGPGKGQTARLLELDVEKFSARVRLLEGARRGEVLPAVAYEDISKVDLD